MLGEVLAKGLRHGSNASDKPPLAKPEPLTIDVRIAPAGLRHHPVASGINSDRRVKAGKIIHCKVLLMCHENVCGVTTFTHVRGTFQALNTLSRHALMKDRG